MAVLLSMCNNNTSLSNRNYCMCFKLQKSGNQICTMVECIQKVYTIQQGLTYAFDLCLYIMYLWVVHVLGHMEKQEMEIEMEMEMEMETEMETEIEIWYGNSWTVGLITELDLPILPLLVRAEAKRTYYFLLSLVRHLSSRQYRSKVTCIFDKLLTNKLQGHNWWHNSVSICFNQGWELVSVQDKSFHYNLLNMHMTLTSTNSRKDAWQGSGASNCLNKHV